MSARSVSAIARELAARAEAVCRHYLAEGRRAGAYWIVGDVAGTPGRSLYVRLVGSRAGRWRDAATGEHGDLLDLIALNRGLDLAGAIAEAGRFLGPSDTPCGTIRVRPPERREPNREIALRLFALARPIAGSLAEIYLRSRGIALAWDDSALRFHPCCAYREGSRTQAWPALIAAVTDLEGDITGIHRTYLDPSGRSKAPVETPRRALGRLRGNGVRFPRSTAVAGFGGQVGRAGDVMAAGEGIETVLSLKCVLPRMPMVAALSAAHLAGLGLPPDLRRLYVARDTDDAGLHALERLTERGAAGAIDVRPLVPEGGDFNADLLELGPGRLRASLAAQLAPEDADRFLAP